MPTTIKGFTYRDGFEIDALEFEVVLSYSHLSLTKIGKLFRSIIAAYERGDFEYLSQFDFIRKIFPHSSTNFREWIPLSVRRDVLSSGPCVTCGSFDRLTVDHITAISKGGGSERSNLQPMCRPCNSRKGARP